MAGADAPAGARQLAAFAADVRWAGLPAEVRAHAARLFLNALGNMLGAAPEPDTGRLAAALAEWEPGAWRAPGRDEALSLPAATRLAGYCASLLDFDDYHDDSEVHPGPTAAPAALLAGAAAGRSLADVLAAFAAGTEVALRIGGAIAPGHYHAGWHATATCGAFGAAAAAAAALGLGRDGIQAALGLALGRAAGTRAAFGTDLKPLHAGFAAEAGIQAAMLAQLGLAGPADPILGPAGFAHTHTDTRSPQRLTAGLGERWELLSVGIKAYPCGIVTHSAVTAALQLAPRTAGDLADATVTVTLSPAAAALVDRPDPTSAVAARMSIQHCVAAALLDGACGIGQFTPQRVADPAVQELRRRMQLVRDPALPRGAGTVQVQVPGRAELSARVNVPPGSHVRPLSDAEVGAKFAALAGRIPGPGQGAAAAAAADAVAAAAGSAADAVAAAAGSARDLVLRLTPRGRGESAT